MRGTVAKSKPCILPMFCNPLQPHTDANCSGVDLACVKTLQFLTSMEEACSSKTDNNSPYTTLSTTLKEIRLLNILAGESSQSVECSLRIASLDDVRCQYETVSYCWGIPMPKEPMRIDGKTVQVPPSSAAVVKCVRSRTEDRLIWIDAICINQSNITERGQQVGLMQDIYGGSAGNIVYLGEADETTPLAIESLHGVLADIRTEIHPSKDLQNVVYQNRAYAWAHKAMTCSVDWNALIGLFSRPWWQ